MSDVNSAAQGLPKIGDILLGKYVVRRLIAQGGMGVVFEGEHNRLNQRVAIKVLLPSMLNDHVVVERFSREARALASVRNAHVAAVYDVDVTPAGLPMMVMEFLEGDDLSRVLQTEKNISDGTKIRWVCDIAMALSEAHSLGIVHRDIKPANIILAKSGGARIVKLVDFGVAKLIAEQSVELTQEAVAVGTPRYMSPEQLLALKNVDHRADIWSLGTTLYMMLANAAPFEAPDTMQLMMAIVQQPFKPLSERRPDLPTELVEVIEWTLRKSPDDRPQTAAQWAEALEPFAESPAVASGRTTTASNPQLRRTAPSAPALTHVAPTIPHVAVPEPEKKPNRAVQAAGALALVAVAVGAFLLTRPASKPADESPLTNIPIAAPVDAGPAIAPVVFDAGTVDPVDAGLPAPIVDAGAPVIPAVKAQVKAKPRPGKKVIDAGVGNVMNLL